MYGGSNSLGYPGVDSFMKKLRALYLITVFGVCVYMCMSVFVAVKLWQMN